MTKDRRHRGLRPKGRSSPTRPRGPADPPRSPPPSKQLTGQVPDTGKDSPRWWMRIGSSETPGRWGALPHAPDTEDDYDYAGHDFPLWWASIRLDDLIQMARANGPGSWAMHAVLAEESWRRFLRERPAVSTGLRSMDWSQVPTPDLITFIEGATAIHMGIDALPREYSGLSLSARRALYLRMLILWGTLRGGPFPLRPAFEAARLLEGAEFARGEIFRRGQKHVGRHMFRLLISQDESTAGKAFEGLRKAIYGRLRKQPTKRAYVAAALDDSLGTGRGPAASLRQEMDAEAFRTGKARWGTLGARGLTLRWLAGKLNIAPRAIVDDLTDAARGVERRHSREELFNEEDIRIDIVEEASRKVAAARHDQVKLDFKRILELGEVRDAVEKFLIRHPEHQPGIEAIISEEPLAHIAKRQAVTVQTVINRKHRAAAVFEKWAQGIQEP